MNKQIPIKFSKTDVEEAVIWIEYSQEALKEAISNKHSPHIMLDAVKRALDMLDEAEVQLHDIVFP